VASARPPHCRGCGCTAGARVEAAIRLHALAVGFDRAFLVAAAICLLMVVVAVSMIRMRRADPAGR
jgi:hypothetical protein